MKKLLLTFVLILLFSCTDKPKNTSNKKIINDCLIGHDWCSPNCENPELTWVFLSDGTFNFNTILFGGNSAQGTWTDLEGQQIELKYTQTTTKRNVPNQIINIVDCMTLNIGGNIYKR